VRRRKWSTGWRRPRLAWHKQRETSCRSLCVCALVVCARVCVCLTVGLLAAWFQEEKYAYQSLAAHMKKILAQRNNLKYLQLDNMLRRRFDKLPLPES